MKRLLISLIAMLMFISACSENNDAITDDTVEEDLVIDVEATASEQTDEIVEEDFSTEDQEIEPKVVEPEYKVESDASIVPVRDGTEENIVLLTIDDVPDKNALEMAKTLHELDAGAIFFVNGHFLETDEQKEMLKEIHEMGFIIGNHTYTHPVLTDISEEEQYEEIVSVSDRVEEIIGERPRFFRAPHGVNSDYSISVAESEGMVVMNWTYGYDYFEPYMNPEKLTEAMVTGEGPEAGVDYSLLKPGANLLMHDREWTNEALANIVTGLRDNGYEIVNPTLIAVNE